MTPFVCFVKPKYDEINHDQNKDYPRGGQSDGSLKDSLNETNHPKRTQHGWEHKIGPRT